MQSLRKMVKNNVKVANNKFALGNMKLVSLRCKIYSVAPCAKLVAKTSHTAGRNRNTLYRKLILLGNIKQGIKNIAPLARRIFPGKRNAAAVHNKGNTFIILQNMKSFLAKQN